MIRKAVVTDLPEILKIYEHARTFMRETGNPTQWQGGYPQREVLINDIEKGQLYVYESGGEICCVFVFFIGVDPTYAYIDGAWLSDEPYGVIHRVASSGKERGVFSKCIDFCRLQISHLRIDTHADNKVMQHTVEKHGFKKCGIIYLENGDPRIAYEYI